MTTETAPAMEAAAPPPSPRTLGETGLSDDSVTQLLLKTLYTGEVTGIQLAARLHLPYALLEKLIERIRSERFAEVRGASGTGTAGYRYVLTDLGRDRARQYLDVNQY